MEENTLRWKRLSKFIKCNLEASPGPCAVAFEYLQGWKFHSLSKQPPQILNNSLFLYLISISSSVCCLSSCPCAPLRSIWHLHCPLPLVVHTSKMVEGAVRGVETTRRLSDLQHDEITRWMWQLQKTGSFNGQSEIASLFLSWLEYFPVKHCSFGSFQLSVSQWLIWGAHLSEFETSLCKSVWFSFVDSLPPLALPFSAAHTYLEAKICLTSEEKLIWNM